MKFGKFGLLIPENLKKGEIPVLHPFTLIQGSMTVVMLGTAAQLDKVAKGPLVKIMSKLLTAQI